MATATAPARLEPISEWDEEPVNSYTHPRDLAGSIAWNVLTHSQGDGPDIARVIGPEGNRRPKPKGMDSEDMWQFVYDLVQAAAEAGYAVAQITTGAFGHPWPGAELRTSSLARAVAALLDKDVIETDEAFDPDWLAKRNAAYAARKAAAA